MLFEQACAACQVHLSAVKVYRTNWPALEDTGKNRSQAICDHKDNEGQHRLSKSLAGEDSEVEKCNGDLCCAIGKLVQDLCHPQPLREVSKGFALRGENNPRLRLKLCTSRSSPAPCAVLCHSRPLFDISC